MRHHNQTPNNQISAMMSIKQQSSMKNNNNSSILANKSVLHHSSWRRKPIKTCKISSNQYYEKDGDKFWQWDLLANTSSRGKRSSILDLSGIIPVSGNRTTLLKKNNVNIPNYRSSSKNKFCMSNRANLREMKNSGQKTTNYIRGNPLSFHIQNDSRCCISAIGMHTHYLNNSIGDSEELIESTSRNIIKKKKSIKNSKYNSGRFQYSSQEGNPNYSSLSNSDFPEDKISNRQRKKISVVNYQQQRKGKSKTSKGYYKTNIERSDLKSNSKSRKRKVSKRNRSSNKAHENAQTPISMNKIIKGVNISDFTAECESIAKRKHRKANAIENPRSHQKNISDNSIMYTSHSWGPNIQDLIDAKAWSQGPTGIQPSYSPYVSNNSNQRKASQRSKNEVNK